MRHTLIALLLLAPAWAATAETAPTSPAALTAFKTGEYEQAAELAQKAGDADALALAARSLLAMGMCGDTQPPADLLADAEALAREAVALEPRHVEGRLQLAIALSLRARPMTTREAMRSGLGDTPRDLVAEVLEDDPANAYAHALMSVWNIEVVRRGGSFGSAVMGASVRKGLRHYREAARLSPDDASIHWQVARALTALNARRYRDEIDIALAAALAAPRDDALEGVMAERAEYLAAALNSRDRREVEALAAEML